MTDDVNDYLMGSSIPSASFKDRGRSYEGRILDMRMVQQRDFATKQPKTFDNGDPMMQAAITIQTTERDDDRDDGRRVIYAKKTGATHNMRDEIQTAVRASGHERLELGGTLKVQFTDEDPETNAKNYRARYTPPDPLDVPEPGGYDDADQEPF